MIEASKKSDYKSPQDSKIVTSSKRAELYKKFEPKILPNPVLNRNLVSYQANKQLPFYSWFKYREGFSEQLVTYLLSHLKPQPGILLDPFAGSGSALFAASTLGWQVKGIEVLPVGIYAIQSRLAANKINPESFNKIVTELKQIDFANYYDQKYALNHIAITCEAFPLVEEKQLIGYIAYCYNFITNDSIRTLLIYAAFCILEDISYTKKDGQYLRWDARSGRSLRKGDFNKGIIFTFKNAIEKKLKQISSDLYYRPNKNLFSQWLSSQQEVVNFNIDNNLVKLHQGSCLEILPTMQANTIDFVITSPPYVNRYDYTRTYALELVFLGCNEEKVKSLRQVMLSCTVENRNKFDQLNLYYDSLGCIEEFNQIYSTFKEQEALHEVLAVLDNYRQEGKLNNPNIIRMVHNYFYEMCFVIYELARLLKPGGIVAMVNDNVQYAGEEIPVDLILSNVAEAFGLTTRCIWTVGRKGNSSQQMGTHGRSELRKCIYIWEKKCQ